MDPATGLLIGGLGSSLLGGLFGSSSASKQAKAELQAARENREYATTQYGLGALQQMLDAYGAEGLNRWLLTAPRELRDQILGVKAASPSFTREQQQTLDEINRKLALPVSTASRNPALRGATRGGYITAEEKRALEAQRDALVQAAGGRAGKAGILNEDALRNAGPGMVAKYGALADDAAGLRLGNLSRFDADTSGLDRMARDTIAYANRMGQGEEARIRRDSERALKNSNRAATAALMSRGLGASSALTDAYRGNAESNQRATDDALGGLADRRILMGTNLRTGRLGLATNRAGARTAMDIGGQDTERGLRLGGLNYEQAAQSGSNYASLLGNRSSSFFPSSSPSAAAYGSLAGSLVGLGSPMAGYGLQSLLGGVGGGGNGGGVNTGLNSLMGGQLNNQQLQAYLAQYATS